MRWNGQTIEEDGAARLPGYEDPVVRTFDSPEALDVRFHEVRARSALNRVPVGARKLPFSWTVNPYRGCTHACSYCFARPTHEFLDLNAGRDFEREIIVKVNAPEVLRAELRRPSWKGERVALGTNTDPYQWVEKRYRLTRAIFEVMLEARNPCSILTKSPLLLRDLDVFQELAAVTEFSACLSIPTLDEKAWRATEPHTPHPRARIEALAKLIESAIPTGVLIAPLMPGINDSDEQVRELVAACEAAGAGWIGGQPLFLRGSTKDVFMGWLRLQRPDLVARYERLYSRGAYLRGEEKGRVEGVLRRAKGQQRGPIPARFDRPALPSDRALALAAAAGGTVLRAAEEEPAAPEPPARQESLF